MIRLSSGLWNMYTRVHATCLRMARAHTTAEHFLYIYVLYNCRCTTGTVHPPPRGRSRTLTLTGCRRLKWMCVCRVTQWDTHSANSSKLVVLHNKCVNSTTFLSAKKCVHFPTYLMSIRLYSQYCITIICVLYTFLRNLVMQICWP